MFWCLKFGHPNYHINEKVEVFIWLCISLYFFYLKCYFITFLTSSQPYYNYFLVFSCQVQANLFALFSFIKSPSKTGYIPYSLIFKLEDSKDSNCISHNKYIHTQSKEVNRSHFYLTQHLSLSHYVKFQSGHTHFSKLCLLKRIVLYKKQNSRVFESSNIRNENQQVNKIHFPSCATYLSINLRANPEL